MKHIILVLVLIVFINLPTFSESSIESGIALIGSGILFQHNYNLPPHFGIISGLSANLDWYNQSNESISINTAFVPFTVVMSFPPEYFTGVRDGVALSGLFGIMKKHPLILIQTNNTKTSVELGYGLFYNIKMTSFDQFVNGRIVENQAFVNHELDGALSLILKDKHTKLSINYLTTLVEFLPEVGYHFNNIIYFDIGFYFNLF